MELPGTRTNFQYDVFAQLFFLESILNSLNDKKEISKEIIF